jgi:hypothetical protein
VWLALAGDLGAARRLADLVALENSSCYRVLSLFERWKRGDREGALRGFGSLLANGSAFHRGEILVELGRDREAVEAFREYRRMPDFPWGELFYAPYRSVAFYPRSMYLEAAALDRLGERGEALKLLRRLLRLWNRADPDAPFVREARAMHARLAAGSTP